MMLDIVGTGRRVLELGCSSGYISRFLAERNCKVTGIEFDPMAAAQARAFCEEVIVADLDLRPLVDLLPGTRFDVALFGDVLEHLRDPWRVLDETRSFLGQGSFVVISVPNVAHGAVRLSLLRGSFNYMDQGLLDATHLRFFTLRSVRELCLRAGYRIEEVRRTKVDMFAKSDLIPPVEESDFDPALIADIRRDPEHDTLQFVIKAAPLGDREKFIVAVADLVKTEVNLERAIEDAEARETEIAQLRATVDELQHTLEATVADLRASEAAGLERQASLEMMFRADLAALENALEKASTEHRNALASISAEHRAALEAAAGDREAVERSLRDEIEALNALRDASQRHRAELEALVALAISDREMMESRNAVVESELAGVWKFASEIDDGTASDVSQAQGKLARLLAEFKAERQTLLSQVADYRSALDDARTHASEKVVLLETMSAQLDQTVRRLAVVENQWRKAQSAYDRLAGEIIQRNEIETKLIREELAATDELIQETYRSKWWSLKLALGRLRFRKAERTAPRA